MPRGRSLENVRLDVRKELLDSANVNVGKNFDPSIDAKLARIQRELFDEHDWSFLEHHFDKAIVAGSRYYDIPSELSVETIMEVRHKWGGNWSMALPQGISMDDYNAHDSDVDERSDPVQKWDFVNVSGTPQIEVWPMPATAATLRFKGKRALPNFVNDTDTCTLDSDLLALLAAAEILNARGRDEAGQIFAKAEKRLNTLKGRSNKNSKINLNGAAQRRLKPLNRIHVS